MTAPNLYLELREKALKSVRSDTGEHDHAQYPVFGVLMDIHVENGSATVVSFADGTASIYVSSGGGIIGGGEDQTVREQAQRFVKATGLIVQALKPVTKYPLPPAGRVRFYALTDEGVVAGEANEDALEERKSPAWPLYSLGHSVITQIRLTTQKKLHP